MPTLDRRTRLFVLVAMPGCGKSTWARTFLPYDDIVSTDNIRAELWPNEPYDPSRNEQVFEEFHRRIGERLEVGRDVIADSTALKASARWKLRDLAAYYYADIHVVFFNNPGQAMRRNASRVGNARLPEDAERAMLRLFEQERPQMLQETYTSITIIEAVD